MQATGTAGLATRAARHPLSGSEDKTVRIWGVDTGKERRVLARHAGPIHDVVVSPDGRRALSCDFAMIRLWDLESGAEVGRFDTGARRLAWAADGRTVVALRGWTQLLVLDPDRLTTVAQVQFPELRVNDIALAVDGRHIATANGNGTIYILRLRGTPAN